MKNYSIRPLEASADRLAEAVNLLFTNCPNESERYELNRLVAELYPGDTLPFYRKFFGAYDIHNVLVGVGGIKAADWASNTHILYLMAVDKEHRGKGVGSGLERIRIEWLRDKFPQGRCLVSTRHRKRFDRWNFRSVSEVNGRYLMILDF